MNKYINRTVKILLLTFFVSLICLLFSIVNVSNVYAFEPHPCLYSIKVDSVEPDIDCLQIKPAEKDQFKCNYEGKPALEVINNCSGVLYLQNKPDKDEIVGSGQPDDHYYLYLHYFTQKENDSFMDLINNSLMSGKKWKLEGRLGNQDITIQGIAYQQPSPVLLMIGILLYLFALIGIILLIIGIVSLIKGLNTQQSDKTGHKKSKRGLVMIFVGFMFIIIFIVIYIILIYTHA